MKTIEDYIGQILGTLEEIETDEPDKKNCIKRICNEILEIHKVEQQEKKNCWLQFKKLLQIEQKNWIPCSERLPEEDGQYLITVKYKNVNDNYEDVYAEHGEWFDGRWDMFCFGHCGEVEDIIAWMPLPHPYKAESGDE